jgi:hypothetical protein
MDKYSGWPTVKSVACFSMHKPNHHTTCWQALFTYYLKSMPFIQLIFFLLLDAKYADSHISAPVNSSLI